MDFDEILAEAMIEASNAYVAAIVRRCPRLSPDTRILQHLPHCLQQYYNSNNPTKPQRTSGRLATERVLYGAKIQFSESVRRLSKLLLQSHASGHPEGEHILLAFSMVGPLFSKTKSAHLMTHIVG